MAAILNLIDFLLGSILPNWAHSKREHHQVMIRFPNWTYLEIQDGGLGPTLEFIDTGDM